MPDNKKIVLVTGASTGFGRHIATLLAQNNYTVYGTSRNPQPTADFHMIRLDVRDSDSVKRCVDNVMLKENRIDVLINNAGYLLSGLIEEVSLDQAQKQFDTNFFGVHRMIRTVLPIMRKQRAGRIITIGSLGGLVAAPGHGFYYASKFALEGYCESLLNELHPFNIRVSIVEPGLFKTNLHNAMIRSEINIPDYDTIRDNLLRSLEKTNPGHDPKKVARLVLKILNAKSPKLRYQIGPGAHWIPALKFLLPQKLFAWSVRKAFHLPDPSTQ